MAAKDAAKDAANDKTAAANAAEAADTEAKLEEKIETTVESVKKSKYDFTKLNLLSLVSLGFSVIGGAVPAIVLGHISLAQIKKTQQDGRIMAIISLVLGYLQVAVWVVGGILMAIAAIVAFTQGVPFDGLDGMRGFGGPGMMGDFGGPGMMGDNRY